MIIDQLIICEIFFPNKNNIVDKFLPKLSQDLLENLNEEYYDITIEVLYKTHGYFKLSFSLFVKNFFNL